MSSAGRRGSASSTRSMGLSPSLSSESMFTETAIPTRAVFLTGTTTRQPTQTSMPSGTR